MALGGGKGQAIVLDNPRDPIAIYNAGQQQNAQNAYRQQQFALAQRKQNDGQISKIINEKYLDAPKRFQSLATGIVNKSNGDIMTDLQAANGDLNIAAPHIQQTKASANEQIAKLVQANEMYGNQESFAKTNKFIDQVKFKKILDTAIDTDDPDKIDMDLMQNAANIPGVYDKHAILSDSITNMKGPLNGVTNISELQNTPLGKYWTIKDDQFVFAKKDDKGNVVPGISDETLSYLLGGNDITNEGRQQKVVGNQLNDVYRWGIAQRQSSNPNDLFEVKNNFDKMQYDPAYNREVADQLRSDIENNFQKMQSRERVQSAGKFKQKSQREIDYENAKVSRQEALDATVNPFGDGSLAEPTRKAAESLEKLRGADFAGGKVTEAKFERGGYVISPEWMEKLARVINTPEGYAVLKEAVKNLVPIKGKGNKVIFTTKTGTMFGSPETANVPLDLSQPGVKVILNAMMNQNKGERKVYYDDLYQKGAQVDIGLSGGDDGDDEDFEND